MRKVTQRIVFIMLVAVTATLVIQVPVSADELPTEMPVVYVEPQSAFADVGTTFNVSVKIFNLTNNFYGTNEKWRPNEPLPPPGFWYNYSLGNMYGFNISFSWDPDVLEYAGRSVKTPVEEYPDGVLHGPILVVQDDVNSTAGTYSIAQNSCPLIKAFNCPNRNATVFTITFKVKKEQQCRLRLESVELMLDPILVIKGVRDIIPHQALDGVFTPIETIHIASMEIGVLVETQLYTYNPLILGEDVTVWVLVTNDGETTNLYNLTFYDGDNPLKTWEGESLPSGKEKIYNYTLKTEDLEIELHTITAKATIIHDKTVIVDSFTKSFTLIDTPLLGISSSSNDIYENDTATLSAATSFHQDPNSQILNYTWLLYEPSAVVPAYEYKGISVTHTFVENGTWRIVLVVRDSWGITYDPERSATTSYQEEVSLEVHTGNKPPPAYVLTWEQIAILITSLTLITVISILVYTTRKKRR